MNLANSEPQASLQAQVLQLQAENAALRAQLDQALPSATSWLMRPHPEHPQGTEEQTRAETMQRVFYQIAERATAGLSFYDFLQVVHQLLRELMFADNFFVALHDHERNIVDYPYYVDEKDSEAMQRFELPYRQGMSEYVMESGKPQLMDAAQFAELRSKGLMAEASSDLSFTSWLGVPMHIHNRMGGVLVVQGYTPDVLYDENDAKILGFFANHVSAAIERYQAMDELRKSEARYRSVIENVGVGVVVVQDRRMVFVNPSMEHIVGHSLQALKTMYFTDIIHPDDVSSVKDKNERRLRGEPVESTYSIRIITAHGELRTLDLSAVLLQWSNRNATLIFVADATARAQAEQNQKRALQQQIELNDLKSRFINMASHEFRTPLAAIHGSVDLLMHYDDRMPADKKRLVLQKIDDAVERMTHMLENVLVIGRSDAGRLQFKPLPLSISKFCKGLIEELRNAMPDSFSKIQLSLQLPPDTDTYLLDETLVRNILGNLLSNAVKYSPHGGDVMLRVQPCQGELVVCVSDQGIGIPLADQPQLFETFHRASNVGGIAGTGLGLSIVREAVQCHQGSISVDSTPGKGSAFTVVLAAPAVSKKGAT